MIRQEARTGQEGRAQHVQVWTAGNQLHDNADVMELGFNIWRDQSMKTRAMGQLKAARKQVKQRWVDGMEEGLEQAFVDKDARLQCNLCRRIGGAPVYKGKRRTHPARTCDPTPQEWGEAMGLAGPAGGCQAEVVSWLEAGEEYDSREVINMVQVQGMWQDE